jgi:hypothetical protein
VDPQGYTPASAAANLRRAVLLSSVLGLVAIVVLSLSGHPWMAVFGCIGLALGAVNNRLLQRSVVRYGMDESITQKKFRNGVMGRLGSVTLIAIACALLVRPDGLALFVGLAVFQLIMLIEASVPVFRSLRPNT